MHGTAGHGGLGGVGEAVHSHTTGLRAKSMVDMWICQRWKTGNKQNETIRDMRYNNEKRIFEETAEGRKEDEDRIEELGETDSQRMARVCLPCMNSINEDLVFTVECAEDFPEKRLPTLDFYLWVVQGIILWSYFEKSMRSQLMMMKRSAQEEQHKMDILSNEMVRRLSNRACHTLTFS